MRRILEYNNHSLYPQYPSYYTTINPLAKKRIVFLFITLLIFFNFFENQKIDIFAFSNNSPKIHILFRLLTFFGKLFKIKVYNLLHLLSYPICPITHTPVTCSVFHWSSQR